MTQLSDNREDKPDLTSHEIALKFSEVFQNHYPKKPLIGMMEELRKDIDDHVLATIGGLEARIKELEAILDKCANFAASTPTYPGKRELQLEVLSILAEKIKAHD